ncbi:MAG: rhodanese-like domain-containing protein [Tabrizicola sp.]
MSTRRTFLLLTGAAAVAGAGAGYVALRGGPAGPTLDAAEAYRRAEAGEVLLVDIRTPEEWARTGSPAPAHRLDMRRQDFLAALSDLTGGDPARPIALICATGGRSARLARALEQAGFSKVFDVAEGMLGSSAGPGWIARGLPRVPG